MLQLYHWEPNGACARVMIAMAEKGMEFQSLYVDVLAFEQHAPDFLKLNETGETPVLVHSGEAFTESSYICEYLDEAYPQTPLMPADPIGRWQARAWQKYVDDHLAASVSDLAWQAYGVQAVRAGDLMAGVERIPVRERRDVWTRMATGLGDDQLGKARERVELTLQKMEHDLESSGWLAGGVYSLADIAVYAYAAYLPRLTPELLSADKSPRTVDWLKRVGARPAVKATLALGRTSDPFMAAAPGPEHVRWG